MPVLLQSQTPNWWTSFHAVLTRKTYCGSYPLVKNFVIPSAIFLNDSNQPPGAARFDNKDTWAYVSLSRETAVGRMRSFCWNFKLIVSKMENKSPKKWQKARKWISFILAAMNFALPLMSAFWDVDARCSMCCSTAAYWPGSLWGSPFCGLMRDFKAQLTWGSHLVPFTWPGFNALMPIVSATAFSSLVLLVSLPDEVKGTPFPLRHKISEALTWPIPISVEGSEHQSTRGCLLLISQLHQLFYPCSQKLHLHQIQSIFCPRLWLPASQKNLKLLWLFLR